MNGIFAPIQATEIKSGDWIKFSKHGKIVKVVAVETIRDDRGGEDEIKVSYVGRTSAKAVSIRLELDETVFRGVKLTDGASS